MCAPRARAARSTCTTARDADCARWANPQLTNPTPTPTPTPTPNPIPNPIPNPNPNPNPNGFQADVFSLGVVLYSLLVGSYPWRDTHASDPVYLRFSRTGHLPGLRDPLAYDLVHRMLRLEPQRTL